MDMKVQSAVDFKKTEAQQQVRQNARLLKKMNEFAENVKPLLDYAPEEDVFERDISKRAQEDKSAEYLQAILQMRQTSQDDDNGFQDLAKAIRIVAKIISGDNVNIKDKCFLVEKFPDMYHRAELMKLQKKKWREKNPKSIAEEGKENQEAQKAAHDMERMRGLPDAGTPDSGTESGDETPTEDK